MCKICLCVCICASTPWSQENVTLLKEINDLRYELKVARTQVHEMEENDSHRHGRSSMSVSLAGSTSGLLPSSSSVQTEPKKEQMGDPTQLHIMEMQRAEIQRLKLQISRAREAMAAPTVTA